MSMSNIFNSEGTILPDLGTLCNELIEAIVVEDFEHIFPQGIRWRGGSMGRESYRSYRNSNELRHNYYRNDPAIKENRSTLDYRDNEYFRFRYTDTSRHCSYRHPQLRNLVFATSKNDVYYLYDNSVMHWSPQLQTSTTILGQPLKGPRSRMPLRTMTMAAMEEFLLVGGEDGSFTFMNLQTYQNPVYDAFTDQGYSEVNGIEMSYSRTGAPHAYFSMNDLRIRCMDLRTLQEYATFETDWFANYTSQSPDGHMIGIVGDNREGQVMSVNSREKIATLKGHQRFSFSVAWSPDSRMIATGSDDMSTCIYDTRKMSDPVHILSRDICTSVRALRYSSCGRYLVMSEERDFVHIVDTATDYSKAQKFDFIGDVSGISLTPDGDGLFVGVAGVEASSLLEFERLQPRHGALNECDYWKDIYL
ncbi:hypothetical protein BG011_004528 [Mortierella polycephala]|uniref:WD40 repeat-like protein n=1 Tax=Mortierella polycephala TaxID=41804 RepID=A0A9P6QHU8_9FUNG|nr:hypothetical protein BG011_004528 [Mortierella polycephala]